MPSNISFKTILRRTGKVLKWLILTIIGSLLLYLLAAVVFSRLGTSPKEHSCEKKETVYLLTNGVHLDIILHKSQVEKVYRDQLKDAENFEYLAFGWGDKGFYLDTPTWAELKASTALYAMFWTSPTAMHVTNHDQKGADFVQVDLCPVQLEQLTAHIFSYFEKDTTGKFILIPDAGYTDQDHFYEAEGSYTAFITCNQWVNKALKAADVKTAVWSPSDHGVLNFAKK